MTDQNSHSDNTSPTVEDSARTEPRRRPWGRLALVAFFVVAAIAAAAVLLRQNGSSTEAGGDAPLNFAQVVITDLIHEETFDGTLGSVEDEPVTTQLGGTVTQIAAPGDTVRQGEALFAIDDQPVVLLYGDLPAFRDIAIGEDTITVSSPLDGTITWVAEPGTVIEQGDVLYRVDAQPVVVLYGDLPAYRSLDVAGPDVAVAAAQANLSSAQASLSSAQASLDQLLAGPLDSDLESAQLSIDAAKNQLWAAQAQRDAVVGNPESSQAHIDSAEASVLSAQVAVDQALLHMRNLTQPPSAAELAMAESQVTQAQAQVDQAQLAVDAVLSEASAAGPGYDVRQLEEALVALGHDPDGTVTVDDEFASATREMVKVWQEDIGAKADGVVDCGEVVFLPGPAQVLDVLAPLGSHAGGGVVHVATGSPASGADVRQLEEALIALGYDAGGALVADGIYTSETTQAVLPFQAATGLEQDSIIDLGEVIFLPGSVRVTSQLAIKGSGVGAGTMVLQISLSEQAVRVNLPASKQGLLAVGDAVTVEMPDQSEVPATVVFVSETATPAQNAWDPATFEVLIELDDPTVAEGLDEAPVDVIAVSDSVEDVMAIPVSALLALLEGGYAVELDTGGGQTQLVAVEVGFFGSNNMVQITSAELQPGDRVVVP
jgi:peptidoglycan hydrolase-like protein with peptidoglycan-binding domain/biotin carboxyl carrier protein